MLKEKCLGFVCSGLYLWASLFLSFFKAFAQGQPFLPFQPELSHIMPTLQRNSTSSTASLVLHLIPFTLLFPSPFCSKDEKNQVLITNGWVQMWVDVYLTWDQYEYPGVQNLRFPADQIWVPDILLYNSPFHLVSALRVSANLLLQAPNLKQLPPSILKSTCYIDVCWFPFGVQKCDLKFGSWTHSGWLIDLQMLEADISNYISNGEWDLMGKSAGLIIFRKRNEMYYECCKEPYPDSSCSSCSSPPCSLPAGIPVLLSLTVFMLPVAEIMPYFASIMVIVGLSVVVTVLVLRFHHHGPQAGKMPRWHHLSVNSMEMNVLPGHQSSNGNTIYNMMDNLCCPQKNVLGSKSGKITCPLPQDTELVQKKALMDTILVIVKILEEVQFIAMHFRKQDEGEEICSEWKFAAAVTDRLCLVAFTIFAIICTFTILMSAPNFIEAVSKDFA
ncbi:unnamed protein product [Bubo scandiacus]